MISRAKLLRSQRWQPTIPEEFKIVAKPQHSSLGKSIPVVALGVATVNEPVYSRTPPDEDVRVAEKTDAVERYFQGRFHREKGRGTPGRSAWVWMGDQMANYGGAVVGTLLQPHAWANSPALTDEEGRIRREFWRDGAGKPTDKIGELDDVAASRAYLKVVDLYRRNAESPIVRRYLPLDQCYPAYVGRAMVAMVIRRKASLFELTASGFVLDEGTSAPSTERNVEVTEVWTPNRCRSFRGDREMSHKLYGDTGIATGYGFVPFVHQIGIPAEDSEGEFAVWGSPILSLVESNIIAIDTVMTIRNSAAMMAGYTSWVAEDIAPPDPAAVMKGDDGMKHLEIKIGMVNYFRGKRISPLLHPGINKDFERAIADEREEIRKIIPDVLFAKPASSGYNSALMGENIRSFFGPIFEGTEILHEVQAEQEMRLLERVPGPVYVDYATRNNNMGVGRLKVSRVKLESSDIGGYYGMNVEVSRVVDRITLSAHLAQMYIQGFGYEDMVLESMGITDTEHAKRQRLVDDFRKSDPVQANLTQDAIEEAGMADVLAEAQAEQQLTQLPDGSQGVTMPDGSVAAPGMPAQLPEQQGPAGAMLGGANLNSPGPNLASTANPTQMLPTTQQPNRFRRKGGAIPGKAQRQQWAKTVGP